MELKFDTAAGTYTTQTAQSKYLPSAIADQRVFEEMVLIAGSRPTGCIVEVGVWKGGSASYLTELAEQQGREIYLYDTFEGIPCKDELDKHEIGDFKDTDYETVKNALPYAKVIKGLFPESAIDMPDVAFLHVDVDQYQSYIDVINYFKPKMVKGGIMWFDDYELAGAKKAVDELIPIDKLIKTQTGHSKCYTIF